MSISDSTTSHRLLYAPFSRGYTVPANVVARLTEDEFFSHCYVDPDFERDESRLTSPGKLDADGYIDEADDGYGLALDRVIYEEEKKIEDNRLSLLAFEDWVANHGESVYCIKGDAGTGKTTFLHHLEYTHRDENAIWEILDLQAAVEVVKAHSHSIRIRRFRKLYYKVVSTLLVRIMGIYLPASLTVDELYEHLQDVYLGYCENRVLELQIPEVRWFFDEAPLFDLPPAKQTASELDAFIAELCAKVQGMLDLREPETVLDKLLDVYMTMLRATSAASKHVIAFDNIERLIGVDEIYSRQIDSFVGYLKRLTDGYTERDGRFRERFQFVVLMRNTSTRMAGEPLQIIDFAGHDLDLSGWFPVDLIVSNKLDWYARNGIDIENGDIIGTIIGQDSFDGNWVRSLQVKIGRLLNRDSRIIVNMLDRAVRIASRTMPAVLERYRSIVRNDVRAPEDIVRFAGRSIVVRLVLDVLGEDHFFMDLRTQRAGVQEERLGYSRKVLTILHDYRLGGHPQGYMPFDELVDTLVGPSYFDENNEALRKTISGILYTMNYYNKRRGDWLHLIDIQYNSGAESEKVEDATDLESLLYEHRSEVGLRIMEAGEAYLEYIVQSFEYFSCRYGDELLPPLLSLVPTVYELDALEPSQLECFRVASIVSESAFRCLDYMGRQGGRDFPYRRLDGRVCSHRTRVINAHKGYLWNFLRYVRVCYPEGVVTYEQARKLDELEVLMESIVSRYREYEADKGHDG